MEFLLKSKKVNLWCNALALEHSAKILWGNLQLLLHTLKIDHFCHTLYPTSYLHLMHDMIDMTFCYFKLSSMDNRIDASTTEFFPYVAA
jgi:hypothetical protein